MYRSSEHDQRPGDPGRNQAHYMHTLGREVRQEIPMPEWHETYDNVKTLGRWLLTERHFDAGELQAYYEKPWKWDDEWEEMRREEMEGAMP